MKLHVRIDGTRLGSFGIDAIICRETCIIPEEENDEIVEVDPINLEYWDVPSDLWTPPEDGDNFVVESDIQVVLSADTVALLNLEVKGLIVID